MENLTRKKLLEVLNKNKVYADNFNDAIFEGDFEKVVNDFFSESEEISLESDLNTTPVKQLDDLWESDFNK